MSGKPEGAGSIWNPNSWHWEMKNYTEVAKRLIEEKIVEKEVMSESHVVSNIKVRFVKAEAEVSIRKGKQHLVYEFELDVSFVARSRSQLAGSEPVEGSYAVKEIASDDLDDIAIEDVKSANKGEEGNKVKAFIKKSFKNVYVQLFKTFAQDLSRIEGDPAKLEQDKKKREQARVEMQKAREEKGEEKERLLEEQRARERQMKEEFSKNPNKE